MLEWLSSELMAAQSRVQAAHVFRMAELGVGEETMAKAGMGVGRVAYGADRLWQPSPDGVPSVILPAYVGEEMILIDLVAFSPSEPKEFALRRGDAVWLGEIEICDAERLGLPATLRDTPLDWLVAGATGAVPLLPDEAVGRLLGLRGITCSTKALGLDLRNRMIRRLMQGLPVIDCMGEPRTAGFGDHWIDLADGQDARRGFQ